MKEASKFVVFPHDAEYHATKEIPFAHHSSAQGQMKGDSLNSLCGVHIGLVGEAVAGGKQMPRLYDEPPPGLVLCRACERLLEKRTGWARLLSHFFQRKRGFRSGIKILGRRT